MNSTPKGSAGIALLLIAAACAARRGPEAAPAGPIQTRRTVAKIAASYPSRISGWRRAA